MTPSAYILSAPLALIAVGSFVVHQQDHSFQTSDRTAEIQNASLVLRSPGPTRLIQQELPPALRFDHERYGLDESAAGGALLGRDTAPRLPGERHSPAPDWLGVQQGNATKKAPLPEIAGYQEPAPPRDPLAEPIASESGYQITSDEVTRLDMGAARVVFDKNVRMVSPRFHLTCDRLVVHLGQDKNTMKLSEAHGSVNVLLTGVPPEKAYRAQSSDAVFDPQKNQIVFTGWPKAKGASQELVAAESSTRMILFTNTGRLLTEGRAQTRVSKSFMDVSRTGSKGE